MPKGRQLEDHTDRTDEYRDWRHEIGHGCYVTDIDQIEWRYEGDRMVPKAVIELTKIDHWSNPDNVLQAILDRIKDKPQGQMLRMVADALGVQALIVVIVPGLKVFFMYSLSNDDDRWVKVQNRTYENWLKSL